MNTVVIATKNKGKVEEFQTLFQPYNIKARSLFDLSKQIPPIEETGSTFEENAIIKAEQISSLLNSTVMADDSGLVVDALNGQPGVYSARYAGIDSTDEKNINKVLSEMKGIPMSKRTAKFVCVIAVSEPGEKTFFKKGICEGHIAYTKAGINGFGYDPIVIPAGYDKTMAQLTRAEKNKISHRTNALNQLKNWLASL